MGRASRRKRGDADVQRRGRTPLQLQGRAETLPTRWQGKPCEARRCKVECGPPPYELPHYWGESIVGEVRRAVEVVYNGERFYLDDEPFVPTDRMRKAAVELGGDPEKIPSGYHGFAWDKITKGAGRGHYAHRDLYPVRVLEYLTDLGLPIERDEEDTAA